MSRAAMCIAAGLLLASGAACSSQKQSRTTAPRAVSEPRSGTIAVDLLGALGARLPETNQRLSTRSLEEAVESLAADIEPKPLSDRPLDDQAARLYANARGAMLAGDISQATELYRRALNEDSGSASIAAALAEALVFSDDRPGAALTFANAYELGDRSLLTLIWVAQGSRPIDERTACAYGAWVESSRSSGSPAARAVSGVVLGRLLLEQGALKAGTQVLDESLDAIGPRALGEPSLRREVIELSTRRVEILTLTGDAMIALGDPRDALARYDRAASFIDRAPPGLIVRRAGALFDHGRVDEASSSLEDAMTRDPGVIGIETRSAMRVIAEEARISRAVTEAFSEAVSDPEVAPSVRHKLLTHQILASASDDDAEQTLKQAPPDALNPLACAAFVRMSGNDAIASASRIAQQNPESSPHLAEALTSIVGDVPELIKQLNTEGSDGARAISQDLAASLARADLAPSVNLSPDQLSPAQALTQIRLTTQRRDFDQAQRIIEHELARSGSLTPGQRSRLLTTLDETGWRSAADTLAEQIRGAPDPSADELIALAYAESRRGDPEAQLNALERAVTADSADERAYEGIISIRGTSGALPDEDELRVVVRDLSTSLPASPLVTLIRAGETAAQGLVSQSEQVLVELNERSDEQHVGIDLLVRLWRSLEDQGDDGAYERGLAWINTRAEMTPGSVTLLRAQAQLLNAMDRLSSAERLLDDASDRLPSRAVERLHEGVLRLQGDEGSAQADQLALQRIAAAPIGIERGVERLEILSVSGSMGATTADGVIAASSPLQLSTPQSRRIVPALSTIVQDSEQHDDLVLEIASRALTMTSDQDTRGALLQISMVALAGSDTFTPDAFEETVRQAIRERTGDTDPAVIAIQALTRAGRSSEATGLLARLSVAEGRLIEPRIANLLSVLSRDADLDSARRVVEFFEREGLTKQAAEMAQRSLGTSERPDKDQGDPRADLLYCVAVVAMFFEREEHAISLYREALTHNPEHAWVLNDLGYHLVERGESVEEALTMLERAHDQLPENASVTDSLAWALYAVGRIADGDDGSPGAVSLLERAGELDASNATVFDHLGDARWMLGDHQGAIDAWLTAEARLRDRLKQLTLQQNPNPDAMSRMRDELREIRYKINDTEQGAAPSIAPSRAAPIAPREPIDPE